MFVDVVLARALLLVFSVVLCAAMVHTIAQGRRHIHQSSVYKGAADNRTSQRGYRMLKRNFGTVAVERESVWRRRRFTKSC